MESEIKPEVKPDTTSLNEPSLDRLKALAYDRIILIEKIRLELQQIQAAINQKEAK